MIRAFQIMVLSCMSLLLTGCEVPEKRKPIWEQAKIGDVATSSGREQLGSRPLKTINFDIHIFEIPAENISKLNDIWRILYTQPLRFRDYKAFRANSFFVRFGQITTLDKVLNLLQATGGHKVSTVSLLLLDGQAEAVTIVGLDSERPVSYISTNSSMEGVNIGPGVLALQIRAGKVPGSKGVCNMIAQPVFSLPISSSVPELTVRARKREFPFTSAAFGLKMSPGDFTLLGPNKYISNENTLGGLFFSKPEGSMFFSETERKPPELKPAVRVFVLVCTGVPD